MSETVQTLPLLYIIGDSISIQYGPYLERYLAGHYRYARRSQQGDADYRLNLDVPVGTNNGDSRMVLEYLTQLEQGGQFHPDLLLINAGLHDVKTDPQTRQRQVSPADYRTNLQGIVALAKRLARRVVWITTTPADETVHNTPATTFHRFAADVADCNAAAREIMSAAGIPLLDLFAFTQSLGLTGKELYADHVHFPEPVRQLQAAHIAGWVVGKFAS